MHSCQITGGYTNAIYFGEGSQGTIENCEIYRMKGETYPSIFIEKSSPNIKIVVFIVVRVMQSVLKMEESRV